MPAELYIPSFIRHPYDDTNPTKVGFSINNKGFLEIKFQYNEYAFYHVKPENPKMAYVFYGVRFWINAIRLIDKVEVDLQDENNYEVVLKMINCAFTSLKWKENVTSRRNCYTDLYREIRDNAECIKVLLEDKI